MCIWKTKNYWWFKINIIILQGNIKKIIDSLENTLNQRSKLRTESWVEINDDAREMYNKNSLKSLKLQCWN